MIVPFVCHTFLSFFITYYKLHILVCEIIHKRLVMAGTVYKFIIHLLLTFSKSLLFCCSLSNRPVNFMTFCTLSVQFDAVLLLPDRQSTVCSG